MAGVLGGAQTANVQNGLPVQYGLGNDPLTHYLARMSRHQLHEVMAELKFLTTQNKEHSKTLLQGIPQLPKALFQAQIMLGMVTPQMMQMAKSQQPLGSLAQSSSHLNEPYPQPEPDAMVPVVSRPSSLPTNVLPNPVILQEQTAAIHSFPQHQHASQPQVKMFPHGQPSGITAQSPMLHQPLGGSSSVPIQSLVTSVGLTSQVQPPFVPEHPGPPVMPTSVQQLPLTHPHLALVAAAPETLPNEIRVADQASHLTEFTHPSKLRKLEDGTSVPGMVNSSHAIYTAPLQAVGPSGPSGSYSAGAGSLQQPGNEGQITPDVESALLQQVLQLTPEQLSSLPPEQQQQVIELQKMLSAGK
ncbi:Cleavage stimulating factor 64 [Zea mays]|nr:Cleavage stimulating factor 64 [Zea mays]